VQDTPQKRAGGHARAIATHLGAHHHPEELSLAHRTIRSACDLVAQLQLVIRQNKVVHQKAEKTRRAGEGRYFGL
jgi:shikimate 5-dehydrogenase